jgi:transposase
MYQPLTDEQWQLLEPFFPKPFKRGRGKPHAPWRNVLNSIFFILHTKLKWDALPKALEIFAPKSVAHRWFLRWDKEGFLHKILNSSEEFSSLAATIASLPRRNRHPKEPRNLEASISA